MKKLVLSIVFFLLVNPAWAAITLVANTCAASSNQNSVTTSGINTTGASLIVLDVSYNSAGVGTISDSSSNSWTELTPQNGTNGNYGVLFYATNPSTSSSQTFTESGVTNYPTICVLAFSGTATSYPLDVQNGAGGNALSVQTGNVSPNQNNEVLVTAASAGTAYGTLSVNDGFTIPTGGHVTYAYNNSIAYLIQTTATSENPTWTTTGGPFIAVTIATFKVPNHGFTRFLQGG